MTHRCAICADPHGGCYGYGYPGPHSKKPEGKRGFLWSCARPECRTEAEARWTKATGQKPYRATQQGSLL